MMEEIKIISQTFTFISYEKFMLQCFQRGKIIILIIIFFFFFQTTSECSRHTKDWKYGGAMIPYQKLYCINKKWKHLQFYQPANYDLTTTKYILTIVIVICIPLLNHEMFCTISKQKYICSFLRIFKIAGQTQRSHDLIMEYK